MAFELSSSAFSPGDRIPTRFTCEGENFSPELHWKNAPEGTKSFVLFVHDPDAGKRGFLHWLVYDIPVGVDRFPENLPAKEKLPGKGTQGWTDFRRCGYGGPCPPRGEHRYFFRIHALDTELNLPPKKKLFEVEEALEGHILATAELMGTYEKDSC